MPASVEDSEDTNASASTSPARTPTAPAQPSLAARNGHLRPSATGPSATRPSAQPETVLDTPPDTAPGTVPDTRPESPPRTAPAADAEHPHGRHHHHHDHDILLDVEDDRWAWRRKIRQNPRQLIVYRLGVGLLGLLLMATGLLTGPLPGPGGIPLVLLGLAVWSSEFEWANRLMHRFKAHLHRYRSWTRWQQVLFWVLFLACCGLIGYTSMAVFGIPGWVPDPATNLLRLLPGV